MDIGSCQMIHVVRNKEPGLSVVLVVVFSGWCAGLSRGPRQEVLLSD